jgi:hypothetical protein
LKYRVQKRHLDGVYGDPSWPYPQYSYRDAGDVDTQAPIQKGDRVNDKKVIEVKHEDGKSIIVIDD